VTLTGKLAQSVAGDGVSCSLTLQVIAGVACHLYFVKGGNFATGGGRIGSQIVLFADQRVCRVLIGGFLLLVMKALVCWFLVHRFGAQIFTLARIGLHLQRINVQAGELGWFNLRRGTSRVDLALQCFFA